MKNLLITLAVALLLSACKKDNGNIVGNWSVNTIHFATSTASDDATISFSDDGKVERRDASGHTSHCNYVASDNLLYLGNDKSGLRYDVHRKSLRVYGSLNFNVDDGALETDCSK